MALHMLNKGKSKLTGNNINVEPLNTPDTMTKPHWKEAIMSELGGM